MRRKKKIFSLLVVLLFAMGLTTELCSVTASAETPYRTYTVDGYGYMEEKSGAKRS